MHCSATLTNIRVFYKPPKVEKVWICNKWLSCYFSSSTELLSSFLFIFSPNSSCLSSTIDCCTQFVSSVNHFVAHHPHFTLSAYERRKSIYFPKIAVSLVYRMKMSLHQDEMESNSNWFEACLIVIMRFHCTPAILIYLQWRWWMKLV